MRPTGRIIGRLWVIGIVAALLVPSSVIADESIDPPAPVQSVVAPEPVAPSGSPTASEPSVETLEPATATTSAPAPDVTSSPETTVLPPAGQATATPTPVQTSAPQPTSDHAPTASGTRVESAPRTGTMQLAFDFDTTLTVDAPTDPVAEGPVTVTATVTPNPGGGLIVYSRSSAGQEEAVVGADGIALLDLGNLSVGNYTWDARYLGTATHGPSTTSFTIKVRVATKTTLTSNRSTAVRGELPVVLSTAVDCCDAGYQIAGTVSFRDVVGGVPVALGPVALDPVARTASLSTSSLRVGAHTITATFTPSDVWLLPSTSSPVSVSVLADTTVAATFTRSRSSVYPYKDGFRDTVAFKGRLDERASIVIKVYDSSNRLRRSWSLGTRNPGAYSVTWNGRTATGASLPAGRYRAKATFRDVPGHTRTLYVDVSLSLRRAKWVSATSTKYGTQGTFVVDAGGQGAVYYSPDYTNGVILDSGPMIRGCTGCGYAAGRYSFGLRSDALEYRYIRVGVRGHGFSDGEHPGSTSIMDPATQKFVLTQPNCEFDMGTNACGPSVDPKYVSSSRRLDAWVWMTQEWGDAYDIYFVRVTYQYAVLI